MAFPADIDIARAAVLAPMSAIASQLDLAVEHLEPYGNNVAKIQLGALEALQSRPQGKYIVVTAITPTPLGEGKTTTSVN